jgi:NitT/TauT family transport system permease protein
MKRSFETIIVFMAFLLSWEIGGRLLHAPAYILPLPSAIIAEIASSPDWYAMHSFYTLEACVLGFLLALVIGIAVSVAIVYSRVLESTLFTLLVSLNSIPKIALAPLFIIWIGTNVTSKIAISALIALFSIVIDTVLGLRSVDSDTLSMARSMRASPMAILWRIRFPAAMPYIFAGMKVAISLALVGAIAGEFVASQVGLGYVILTAQGMFNTTRVFAAIVLLGVLGTALFYLLVLIERFVIPWHVSHRTIGAGDH